MTGVSFTAISNLYKTSDTGFIKYIFQLDIG